MFPSMLCSDTPLSKFWGMARGKFLTEDERHAIRTLAAEGVPLRKIAEALRRSLGACQGVVTSAATPRLPVQRGRAPAVTEREKRQIIRSVSVNKMSASAIKEALNLSCSVRTVQRVVEDVDWLKYKKIGVAPMLSKVHKERRLKWGEAMALMDDCEWSHVAFSDEKKWNLDGPDGMRYQWVDTRQPEALNVARHSGGGSVMVWAAFCGNKKSVLKFLVGKQDSVAYVSTLETHLLPFIDAEIQIFQQDNAPIHKSQYTMRWLEAQNIEVLDWPALSPDLNPIENVWGIMTQHVYAGGRQYYSVEQLKKAILKAWDAITPETLEALTLSMRKRCVQLISKRGAYISY
jgi:transposase